MKRASGTASRRDLARVWTARAWWRAWRGVARGLAWRRRPAAPRSSLVAWHAAWTCETGSQRSVPAPCAAQSARRSRGGGSGRPTSSINSNKFFGRGRKNGTGSDSPSLSLDLRLLADGLRQLLRSYALFEWHTRTTTIADIHKRAPAPLGTALTRRFPGSNAAAPLPAKDKVQRNHGSAYITLPVLGSMRLPATKPVVGSVPFGRRKSRMCGSGLAAAGAGQAQRECATRWRMQQGSGGCDKG